MHLNTADNQIKKCVGNIILFFYLILTFKFYIGRYLRFHFLFLGVNDITESKFQALDPKISAKIEAKFLRMSIRGPDGLV